MNESICKKCQHYLGVRVRGDDDRSICLLSPDRNNLYDTDVVECTQFDDTPTFNEFSTVTDSIHNGIKTHIEDSIRMLKQRGLI